MSVRSVPSASDRWGGGARGRKGRRGRGSRGKRRPKKRDPRGMAPRFGPIWPASPPRRPPTGRRRPPTAQRGRHQGARRGGRGGSAGTRPGSSLPGVNQNGRPGPARRPARVSAGNAPRTARVANMAGVGRGRGGGGGQDFSATGCGKKLREEKQNAKRERGALPHHPPPSCPPAVRPANSVHFSSSHSTQPAPAPAAPAPPTRRRRTAGGARRARRQPRRTSRRAFRAKTGRSWRRGPRLVTSP